MNRAAKKIRQPLPLEKSAVSAPPRASKPKPGGEASEAAEIRRRARRRGLLIPGAGWWELGYPAWGWCGFAVALATMMCFIAFALFACVTTYWSLVVCVSLYVLVSGVEYATCRWWIPRETSPAPRRFRLAVLALIAGLAAGLVAMLRYDGLLMMRGTAMFPTVHERETLFFSRFMPLFGLKRGAAIAYEPDDVGRGDAGVARVLALPGDTVSIHNGRYWVNGQETPAHPGQRKGQRIEAPAPFHPATLETPPGMYFIAVDNPAVGYDSQVLGWIPGERILSSRMLLFSRRAWAGGVHQSW